ncbi:unnamed protein product [Heligmosomoides polygyrus]|uniref:Trehalase n=1 Tax=Heligmosomoides polygyrus TaxID=6339 RepID=A0A183G823_HELPZ|nr:unnamed protein product [Heligmosomoides polygyrus]
MKETVEVCDEFNAPGRYMIYCSGKLLQSVMAVKLYNDSKTFVDKPMKEGRVGTDVQKFVDEHFDEEGHELCELPDWVPYPPKFKDIVDDNMRAFALKLNVIWKDLCREVKPAVKDSPERFSIINVPNPFLVLGGRFREFYYWDSRSHPPLFSPMVYEYYQATRDKSFVREMLPIMEKEHDFWNRNRSLNIELDGEAVTMYQYRTPATVPRPESYREDVFHGERLQDENRKRQFYQDIGSAAESGWDFSTRWFTDNKSLTSIETTNILPVDLNAFICYNMHIIGNLHGEVGERFSKFREPAQDFREKFEKVFWVEKAKGWYDYNLRTQRHNTGFYASMAVPLFTQCYEPDDLYSKMEEMGVFGYKGGIPASLQPQSGQQWDFPNGWSPLNHMIIEGLRKSSDPRMQQKAFVLAQKWLLGNLHVFENDQAMWEKYDVVSSEPKLGGGGEYDVQVSACKTLFKDLPRGWRLIHFKRS